MYLREHGGSNGPQHRGGAIKALSVLMLTIDHSKAIPLDKHAHTHMTHITSVSTLQTLLRATQFRAHHDRQLGLVQVSQHQCTALSVCAKILENTQHQRRQLVVGVRLQAFMNLMDTRAIVST